MTLVEVAKIIEILGVLAVIAGIGFGLLQLKQNHRQRRDMAILEVAHSFEDRDFTEAYKLLTELENGISNEQLEALGDEYLTSAFRVIMKFETIGLLVFKGVVPMHAMEDLVGGAALNIWGVLKDWAQEIRKTRGQESFLEWYQWLAERLEERGESIRPPAHIEHANWIEPKH